MLLRRFQAERDRSGEVVTIPAAGQGVLDVCQRLVERAPTHRDALDLDMAVGAQCAENAGKFTSAILTRRVVEE